MHVRHIVMLGLLLCLGGQAAADRDLTLANRSTRTINEIYASPANSDSWGTDQLADSTIEPGQSAHLRLKGRECVFDIQVIFGDASREERHRVDVCRTKTLAFDGSQASALPGADGGDHRVTLLNQNNRPIQQVFISPSDAGDWGEDRMGDGSISVGEAASVGYRGACLADLRVVFDNRSAEERRGLDLCALGGITVAPGWTTADALAPQPPNASIARLSVTVVNHAGRDARELYVFPDMAGARGPDLLGSVLLEDGGQRAVAIPQPRDVCKFSAHVVYGGKIPDQDLTDLDLCRTPSITLPPRS